MPPIDKLLSQYSAPVRSWPGEEDLDAEAYANWRAANPPKLQTEGGSIDKGDLLPIVRYPTETKSPSEWQSSSDVMRQLDDGWRVEPFSRLTAPFKSMAEAWRTQPVLGPMVRPSQMRPEVLDQMSSDAMTVAGTGMTGGFGRAAAGATLPAGTAELGIFGGRKARTADLDALARAEEMTRLGAPREDVWSQTGWFTGPDGKWRFEIDDSGAKALDPFNEPGLLDIHQRADPNTAGNTNPVALHLDDILPHEELYKAYGYSDVPNVGFDKMRARGTYDPSQDHITLNNDYVLEPNFGRSTLLHELQHAVQRREGTATGGNPSQFDYTHVPGTAVDTSAIDDLIRSVGFRRPDDTVDARSYLNALFDQVKSHPSHSIDDTFRIADEMKRIDKMRISPEQQYRRLAGETEARAVQARQDLTPEQRRARAPWLDYDVPEKDQIVRFGSGEGASANSRAQAVPFDRLPAEVKQDIAGWVTDNIPAVRADVRGMPEYAVQHLEGLVQGQPLGVRVFDMPIAEIKGFDRVPSDAAVSRYQGMLAESEAPPILMDGDRFVDGGHRLEAYRRAGRTTIPAVDIGPILRMNWDNWLAGVADDPSFPVVSRVSSSPNLMASIDPLSMAMGSAPPRSIDPLGYYSPTLEAALKLSQNKGTPEQMLAQLKKAGAKDSEIEVSGLKKMFEGKKAVTKDEIVKALEEGKVGLQEKIYGRNNDYVDNYVREAMGTGVSEAEAREWASRAATREGMHDTKYSNYSLDPQNPTYREVVLHLPDKTDAQLDAFMKRVPGGDEFGAVERFIRDNPEFVAERDRLVAARENVFRSGHFDEPNIVGHMMVSETRLPDAVVFGPGARERVGAQIARATGARSLDDITKAHVEQAIASGAVPQNEALYFAQKQGIRGLPAAESPRVLTLDQVQSDWGQKLRDGGVRDEAKVVALKAKFDEASAIESKIVQDFQAAAPEGDRIKNYVPDARDRLSQMSATGDPIGQAWRQAWNDRNLFAAELRTAQAASPGHPLVNTTDQWLNTTLRRAIRMAAEEGQDYIAIPSGNTVLGYNPGQEKGMLGFYGGLPEEMQGVMSTLKSAAGKSPNEPVINTLPPKVIDALAEAGILDKKKIEGISTARVLKQAESRFQGIVPKNLGALLQKLDKNTPPPQVIDTLDSPSGATGLGQGFTLFRITPEAKKAAKEGGQPLFRWGGRVN